MKLTAAERDWFDKAMEAALPAGGDEGLARSALEAGAAEVFQEMLELVPAFTALGLRAGLWFIEFAAPPLTLKKFRRFSRLEQTDREACLAGMSKSDVYLSRQMATLMKMFAGFAWGADPEVRAALGYDRAPRFVKRKEIK